VDRLSAHLDRGWDLAQKGDADGAVACAKRALESDPESPEVHNLLGYATALAGDAEEAVEHYRQAIALDENYFEAMLNAAELLVSPLEEHDEAIALVEEALEVAENPEEVTDCLLLKADALVAKGEREEVAKVLRRIPKEALENANYGFLAGRAWFEAGDLKEAAPLLEAAVTKDPANGDAHYYIGMLAEARGDTQGAVEAFLRTRVVDLNTAAPPWAPLPDTFGNQLRKVLEALDPALAQFIHGAEVYIVDLPGAEVIVDGVDPRASVLVETPAERPVRLFVYQRNVERASGALSAIEEELAFTIEREITSVFVEGEPASGPVDKSQLN